ncbi:hypothetical protein PIB30_075272 [Stylosanthes scabra]|uniref:Uncharacterized protein n=1 Tax=Stylosanthes scabra TaxID=79078 RepID=A0ABU6WR58_9FABA|nr:hypothetical protein [Stylosanthes scabra]
MGGAEVIQHFYPPQETHIRDSLDALTLRSGTQLQEPTIPEPTTHTPPGDAKTPDIVRNTEEPLVTQEEAIASKKRTI